MSTLEDLARKLGRKARFDIERAINNQFYWILRAAGNLEPIAVSETYVSKEDCLLAIRLAKEQAAGADIHDNT